MVSSSSPIIANMMVINFRVRKIIQDIPKLANMLIIIIIIKSNLHLLIKLHNHQLQAHVIAHANSTTTRLGLV
jgi:hypothetical protein